jgi:glycosyltransferase involved in cell wall biosynthesis
MKVLVVGWTRIPHSYAIVNVFQLIHLLKNYPDLELYKEEYTYFNKDWEKKMDLVLYPKGYENVLESIPVYSGEDIDLVYSITYPYDISVFRYNVPKIVFYTAEFSVLTSNYFTGVDPSVLGSRILENGLYFHSPSQWSFKGLSHTKNKIITHGVDLRIFKKNLHNRKKIREFYNVKDTDILLGNMGAMTRNKGIVLILEALKILVIDLKQTHYKLLLKGTGDLYKTRDFLGIYLKELNCPKEIQDHIIFIEDTLSFETLNEMYNILDLYLSPYIAEGFNLQPLECLSTGVTVMLPETGSTVDYTSNILKVSPDSLVMIPSTIVKSEIGFQNSIDVNCVVNGILNLGKPTQKYKELRELLEKEFSWDCVSHELYKYFQEVMVSKK